MNAVDEGQLVAVDVGDCRCPGSPHASDIVYLAPRITIPMGIAATSAYRMADNRQDLEAALGAIWLRYGIKAWTFVEADASASDKPPTFHPVEITPETIERLIPWTNGGFTVADKADDLYAKDFLDPLVARSAKLMERIRKSSNSGRTDGSTSRNRSSGGSRRTRSGRSSLNGQAGKPSVAPVP